MSTINNQPSETARGQLIKFICSPEKTKFLQNFLYSVKKLNFFKFSCHWTKKNEVLCKDFFSKCD